MHYRRFCERRMNQECQTRPGVDTYAPRSADFTGLCSMLITRAVSFDDLVGAGEKRWWHFQAERLGRLEVDEQLHFRGLLDWKVGGLLAQENPAHVDSHPAIWIGKTTASCSLRAVNNASLPITSALARSGTKPAKLGAKSRSLLAFRTWISNPSERADACISFDCVLNAASSG
jgi:hypothetical protein